MVKWIHIADVHLGASPDAGDAYSKVRPQELWDTFAEVMTSVSENRRICFSLRGICSTDSR